MKRGYKKSKVDKRISLLVILFLLLGGGIGYGGSLLLTKNDTFELIGEKNITLNVNEIYNDSGVKVISYGKDLTDKVHIDSDLDLTKEGEYTIIYTVKSIKYKDIKRVRYITVRNGSDGNE